MQRVSEWVTAAGEWIVLLPLWRRWIGPPRGRVAAAVATGVLWGVLLVALVGLATGDDDPADGTSQAAARDSVTPTRTARPTRTRTAKATPTTVASDPAAAQATPTSAPLPAGGPTAVPGGGNPAVPQTAAPPLPAPGELVSFVSSSSYTDSGGDLHVAGEVRSNAAEYLDFVEITGMFFDTAGQLVGSEFTYTHADFVAPGEIAGFDLELADGANLGVARYDLAVQGEPTAERPAAGLLVQGDTASVDEFGDYRVLGQVLNQSGATVEFVKVIGTFYGADGTVVRSDFTYIDADVIDPGQAAPFDLVVPEAGAAGIARYSLKVEGFPV